ncbi:Symplekin [Bienertia sinuspersici]
MAVNSKEQALSLLASANNHGDLAVKLSSLRQVKDILSSSHPSIASEVFPFLVQLQSSHESLVRKLLLDVMDDIGLRMLEHSSMLMPVLLSLLKDEDPGVARQAIVIGMKFFYSILQELAQQFLRDGKVERWAEEMWMQMSEFKDAVLSLLFKPISVGIRLLALKFSENCILLFTPDEADSDKLTSGDRDKEHSFNVSWVASGHPVLDSAKLVSEANKLSASLLDMLQSSSAVPGPLTIGVEEQSSTQLPPSGDPIKRKLLPLDDEEPDNGLEMASKRMRYTLNGKSSDLVQVHGSADDNPVVNGTSSEATVVNSDLNPIEQMIAVIAALLAEGERAAESLELLISQIHPDLLADIVITNMKHLPKIAPLAKQGIMPSNGQSASVSAVQGAESTSMPVHSSPAAQQGSIPAAVTSVPEFSGSTTLPVDSKRDPRRDPRRLDPRRAAVPVDVPSSHAIEEATPVSSVSECPASVNKSTPSTAASSSEQISSNSVPDADGKIAITLLLPAKEEIPKEEGADGFREISSPEATVLVDRACSPDLAVNESSFTLTSLNKEPSQPTNVLESDDDSPSVSNASVCEDTCKDLPQVPSYIYLTEKQRQTLRKSAVERIVKSYKQSKNNEIGGIRMSLLARLVSWGHDLVMHILYHLYGLTTAESSERSPDKSFSRLLGEAPLLTDSVMGLLEKLCCPDGSDIHGKDVREDRVTQGLGSVWSLILGRPLNRQACLNIALKCAVHLEDDTRAKAIRLVSNKLYQLNYVSETIEQYAKNMLLSAVDYTSDTVALGSVGTRVDEETSVSSLQLPESGTSHAILQDGACLSLLKHNKPGLLQLVFDVYARAGKSSKQAIHRHIPILLRALGSSYSQLLRIISDPPMGSESLLMLVLQILAEQTTPSPDLISTVKHLYETKLKDATILIPMLSSLSKNEVTDACSACFEQRTVFTQHVLAKALNQIYLHPSLKVLSTNTLASEVPLPLIQAKQALSLPYQVLGLAKDSHSTQPHVASPLNTSDTSSVRGETST